VVAQLLAGTVFTPIDVVKERLQVTAHSFSDVVKYIYKTNGIFGFWKGYIAAVALWAPYGAIYLAMNRSHFSFQFPLKSSSSLLVL